MKSMTGYGSAHDKCETAEIEVNVRTVNGRFLELRVHLPREYFSLESEIRKIVGQKVQRGSVDVFVSRRRGVGKGTSVIRVAPELAHKWVRSFRHLAGELGIEESPTMQMLLSVPEVLRVEESSHLGEGEGKALLGCLERALTSCDRERRREGQALKRILQGYLSELQKISTNINKIRGEANRHLQKRFEQRLGHLKGVSELDPQRIAQEIAIQIDKTDINEELTRLTEHIGVCRKLLTDSASHGKKMDFYTQELLREVNTIGSKAQWAKITHQVVESKAIIEKLREQVQNIE